MPRKKKEQEKEQEREREKEREKDKEIAGHPKESDNGDMGRVRATEVPEVGRIYAETPRRAYVFLVSLGAAINVRGPRRGRGI
jgi:hypothetical protein